MITTFSCCLQGVTQMFGEKEPVTLPNKTTGCTYKVILRKSPKWEWDGLGAASLSSLLNFPLKYRFSQPPSTKLSLHFVNSK